MAFFNHQLFGKVMNYAQFDGVDDFISIPNAAHNNPADISILLWVNWNTAGNKIIIEKSSNNTHFLMHTADNGTLYFGTDATTALVSSPIINDGFWHPVMVTYKASTQRGELFVNGFPYAAATLGVPVSNTSDWHIGARAGGSAAWLGKSSDILMYNRVLSYNEYLDWMEGVVSTTGLIGRNPLDGNANDTSSYANHGTAFNGVTFGTEQG